MGNAHTVSNVKVAMTKNKKKLTRTSLNKKIRSTTTRTKIRLRSVPEFGMKTTKKGTYQEPSHTMLKSMLISSRHKVYGMVRMLIKSSNTCVIITNKEPKPI
jgi:replication initiation and membrane attachment protein DnaB